jgi:alkylation response protein AidB-like acyl-CoA dehydrogenase
VAHLGRAITTYGTPEQCREHLPPLLSGTRQWCQGFSEPDAGSDIASLRTRAVLDGDHYVVNGQKMWTSEAEFADWCLLLVRTDPEAPKHRGISCLVTPMERPGITVNPIKTADGSAHTCLVFWDDVEVDRSNLLGPEGAGWNIAMTTFAYERGPADVGFMAKYFVALRQAEALARRRGLLDDDEVRRSLAMAYVRGEALRLNVREQLEDRTSGRPPGPEGSVSKMLQVEASQAVWHLLFDLDPAAALTRAATDVGEGYLGSRAASVYGGSVQIQRNILSGQLLGLPRW